MTKPISCTNPSVAEINDVSVQITTDVGFANITDIDKIIADHKSKTLEFFSDGHCCLTVEYVDSKSLEKAYWEIYAVLREHKNSVLLEETKNEQ